MKKLREHALNKNFDVYDFIRLYALDNICGKYQMINLTSFQYKKASKIEKKTSEFSRF